MTTASDVVAGAYELDAKGILNLKDAAAVICDEEGKLRYKETRDVMPSKGAALGGYVGLLAGALFTVPVIGLAAGVGGGALLARKINFGISPEFQKEIGHALRPGTSACFLVGDSANRDAAIDLLSKYHGKVLQSDLAADADQAVREALESESRDSK